MGELKAAFFYCVVFSIFPTLRARCLYWVTLDSILE